MVSWLSTDFYLQCTRRRLLDLQIYEHSGRRSDLFFTIELQDSGFKINVYILEEACLSKLYMYVSLQ